MPHQATLRTTSPGPGRGIGTSSTRTSPRPCQRAARIVYVIGPLWGGRPRAGARAARTRRRALVRLRPRGPRGPSGSVQPCALRPCGPPAPVSGPRSRRNGRFGPCWRPDRPRSGDFIVDSAPGGARTAGYDVGVDPWEGPSGPRNGCAAGMQSMHQPPTLPPMALTCPECAADVAPGAKFCPECGARQPERPAAVARGPQARHGPVRRRDRVDRPGRAAGPGSAPRPDEPLLRPDALDHREPRRDGREVHRRCRDGRVRDPPGPRGRRPARGPGRGRDPRTPWRR